MYDAYSALARVGFRSTDGDGQRSGPIALPNIAGAAGCIIREDQPSIGASDETGGWTDK